MTSGTLPLLEAASKPHIASPMIEKLLLEKTPSDIARTIVTFLPSTWNPIGEYHIEIDHYLKNSRLVALPAGYFLLGTRGNVQLHQPHGTLQETLYTQELEDPTIVSCLATSKLLPSGNFYVAATLERNDANTLIKIWHLNLGAPTQASLDVELAPSPEYGNNSIQSLVFSSHQDATYLAAANNTTVIILRSRKNDGNFRRYLQIEDLAGSGPWSSSPLLSFPTSYLLTCSYHPFITAIKLAHTAPMYTPTTRAIESSIATTTKPFPRKIIYLIEQYAQLITKTIRMQHMEDQAEPRLSLAPSDYRYTLINTQKSSGGSVILFDRIKDSKSSRILAYRYEKKKHVNDIALIAGMIAVGFNDGTIQLWEQSHNRWHSLPSSLIQGGGHWGIASVSLSPDGNTLATLTFGGRIAVLRRSCIL